MLYIFPKPLYIKLLNNEISKDLFLFIFKLTFIYQYAVRIIYSVQSLALIAARQNHEKSKHIFPVVS